MLEPKVKACIKDNCSSLKITEISLAYNEDTNEGGWGFPNVNPNEVDSITVVVTGPTGESTIYPIDLIDIIEPVVGEFELITIPALGDGSYTIKYIVVVEGESLTYSTSFYNLCSVRCCVDKLWAKAATETTVGDCGCHEGKATYSKKASDAEALYSSILSCIACNKPVTRDLLLKKLQRLCNLEKCNCG